MLIHLKTPYNPALQIKRTERMGKAKIYNTKKNT
jgi:hypothetical protein